MATVGFKVPDEYQEHIKQLIEASGDQPGEWFRKAVSLVELQSIKQGASEYAQDLNELEVHTSRIYELINNMIQRSIYTKDAAVQEVSEKLDQKEIQAVELQEKIRLANETAKTATDYAAKIEQANDGLLNQLNDLRGTNENNQLLINQYKEKIDNLSGIINEYKGYKEEIEQLKSEHHAELKEIRDQFQQIVKENNDQKEQIRTLQYDLKEKDVERDKAILQIERQYNAKLGSAHEEYSSTLKGLYEEINNLRQSLSENRNTYEERIKTIMSESEKKRNQNRGGAK